MKQSRHNNLPSSQQELDKMWSHLTFGLSNQQRLTTDRIMSESFRVRDEHAEQQGHRSAEVEFHLNRRIKEMELWIQEFTKKSEQITVQIDTFGIYQTRIQNALKSIPPIIKVNQEIFKLREMRQGIDLIDDQPHHNLVKEVSLLNIEQEGLKFLNNDCMEMIRLLRKMGYSLGKQLEDRRKAKSIDNVVLSLTPHSSALIEGTNDKANYRHNTNTEAEWERFSWEQRTASEKLLREADNFLVRVESALRQTCENIQTVVCKTNGEFEKRLIGLRILKSKLEDEHREVSINVRVLEDTIDKLKKCFEEKHSMINLVTTRLHLRTQRPNAELVNDQVFKGLKWELMTLTDSLSQLNLQLQSSQKGMQALLSNQLKLESEINVKVQAIAIDEIQVLPLRKTISVQMQ